MSYNDNQDGTVTLTMTRQDFELLLMCLGAAAALAEQNVGLLSAGTIFGLVNRLNEGNPNYRPYAEEPTAK